MTVSISPPTSQIRVHPTGLRKRKYNFGPKTFARTRVWNFRPIFALIIIFSIFAKEKHARAAPSVTKMFQAATGEIRQGNFPAAEKILRSIISQFPGYEPAYILLARVEYRQGDQISAFRHFKKVNPASLDSDAAFEYGLIAYARHDCTRALSGFKRVVSSDDMNNFAKFYSGVCYLRVRNYAKVITSLRQATELPPELSALRRKMLRIALDRVRIESSGQSLQPPAGIIAPPPAMVGWGPLPPEPGETRKAPKKKDADSGTMSRINYSATPTIDLKNTRTESEYSGTRNSSIKSNSFTGGGRMLARYDLKATSFGEHPNLGLGLDLSEAKSSTSSSDVKYFLTDGGNTETEEVSKPEPAPNSFVWIFKPSAGFPLSKDVDLALL
jgi:Tfp pilus assembly protein PilF